MADRDGDDSLRKLWSDLADQDARDAVEHLPSILEEVTRQIRSTEAEIGRLKRVITRLQAAALPVRTMSDLLAVLEETEASLKRFLDELPPSV